MRSLVLRHQVDEVSRAECTGGCTLHELAPSQLKRKLSDDNMELMVDFHKMLTVLQVRTHVSHTRARPSPRF
jgi:hypothetical protein